MTYRAVGAVLAVLLAAVTGAVARAETQIADIREGTDLTLALAPDGGAIVVSLLGGLWRLPATGGAATALVPSGQGAANPRFDPTGRRVVYERVVDGQWDLWLYDLERDEAHALTRTAYDERHPDFTPDGGSVVFAADRTGEFRLWRRDVDGGQPTAVSSVPGDQSFPAVSASGDIAYVNRTEGGWSLRAIGADGADVELYSSEQPLAAPSWRPGGGVILFTEVVTTPPATRLRMIVLSDRRVVRTLVADEDVFVTRAAWPSPAGYLYAADGRIWRRGIGAHARDGVPLFAAAQVETVAPQASRVPPDAPGPHRAAGVGRPAYAPDGKLGVVTALGDLWRFGARNARRLTDDRFVELDPAFLPDGRSIVYTSDRGGIMNIWQLDLEDGRRRQLSFGEGKAFSPVPDPDGRQIAYLTTGGFGPSAEAELRLLSLDSPAAPRILARGLADAGDLAWDTADGADVVTLTARIASESRASRRLAFDLEGRPVAVDGGPAVSPAPSEDDAAEIELPELEWTPRAASERYVVEVGRLFDGIRSTYARHMDIHVAGQRIEAIVARGTRALPEHVVDLRDSTVIPGLIDTHVHESTLLGERLGRAWLAYGVTGVRELADDVAGAVERAESWASGRRPGPRLVVAPTPGAAGLRAPLPADSPVRIEPTGPLTDSLAHALTDARRRARLPAIVVPGTATAAGLGALDSEGPVLPVSALGRSYQDVESTLLASGRYVGTGLAALEGEATGAPAGGDGALARLWTPSERERWSVRARADAAVEPLGDTITRLIRHGARVGVGSDAPLTPYGLGLHRELELLEAAGIPRDQVLRLATAEAALALGLDRDLGTLEPGKLADFVVVDGDPLRRISDARRVRAVVIGGVWYDRADLLDEDD